MDPPSGRPRLPVRETFRSLRLTGLLTRSPLPAGFSILVAALVLAATAAAAPLPPQPNAALPTDPTGVARSLEETSVALHAGIDVWRAHGGTNPPTDVTLYALYEQRLYRMLSTKSALASATYAE